MNIREEKVQVVSFSGGRTSAYMVALIEEMRKSGQWCYKTVYVFCDTGAEHPLTYIFLKACVEYFGIDLVCIKAKVFDDFGKGNSYEIVDINDLKFDLTTFKRFMAKYGGATINRPLCTEKMKTIPLNKYLDEMYGKGNHVRWLGMRTDEPARLKQTKLPTETRNHFYLAEISDFTKEDVIDWWSEMPFDLQIEEHLGNCIFCIKKSSKKVALAERYEPEKFKLWRDAQMSDEVRLMDADKFGIGHIYRDWMTPDMLIQSFADVGTEDLRRQIYKEKMTDTGSCSESCEAL